MLNCEFFCFQSRSLIQNHPSEELTWYTIAKKEYLGKKCNWKVLIGKDDDGEESEESDDKETESLKNRIERVLKIYKESLKKLNTDKMWEYYLSHLHKICNANYLNSELRDFTYKILIEGMKGENFKFASFIFSYKILIIIYLIQIQMVWK